MAADRHVLVIGGGIAGLAAAYELAIDRRTRVTVLERDTRLGGKIATSPFAGLDHVDEGADAFLTRVPHAVELSRQVGLADQLVSPTEATASVWHHEMHDIPGGVVLGVPASIAPFVTTGLLSWRGKARAAIEPILPRTDPDDSLGKLVRARFGREVHERLVDALIGSIYATDTDRASLAAVPQLALLAASDRSLLLGARRMRRSAPSAAGPIFAAPVAGMAALVDATAAAAVDHGAVIRTDRPVERIEPDRDGWRVDGERYDAVLLATPAAAAGRLLSHLAPAAASALGTVEYADVAMVRMSVVARDWPDRLRGRSGYLVPKPVQGYVTAASFASEKWAHLRPTDGRQLVRVSLGRDGLPVMHLDDDEIIAIAAHEVGNHLGIDLAPADVSITRWHDAFPQYRPHHHRTVADIRRALPAGLAVTGASYDGIGIPACIASGRQAARSLTKGSNPTDEHLT